TCAVNGLRRVAKEVTKKGFGTEANTKFAYFNPAGESILSNIQGMRRELAEAKKESVEAKKEFEKKFTDMEKTLKTLKFEFELTGL
ncbi:hypothetical protein L873DRAFT_1812601, partial [Choiromyces venosus 120613-1]